MRWRRYLTVFLCRNIFLRRQRDVHPRVQKITLQRFQQAVAILQGGDAAQRFLHRALAAADQLLALPGKIDLLQRVGPLPPERPALRRAALPDGSKTLRAHAWWCSAHGSASAWRGCLARTDRLPMASVSARTSCMLPGPIINRTISPLVDVGDGGPQNRRAYRAALVQERPRAFPCPPAVSPLMIHIELIEAMSM